MANLRTLDYKGFNYASSSATGVGSGLMLWSGSNVLKQGNIFTSYSGIGMELVGSSKSYLRFQASSSDNDGIIDIKASEFFVGTQTTQYVSGSSGNIEISSSNFHLKPDGGLIIGGDTVIEADLAVNQLFVPSTATDHSDAKAYISKSGESKFVGDGNGNYVVDFSLEGTEIAGFGISTTAISSSNENLILMADGRITASSGEIGGFQLSSTEIKSSNNNLRLKSSGEITASSGEIASWTITDDKIKSEDGTRGIHLSASYGLKVFNSPTEYVAVFDDSYQNPKQWGIKGRTGTNGRLTFELGETNQIASWSFNQDRLVSNMGGNTFESPGILLKSDGSISTDPFISGLTANAFGWQIRADGKAEFENAVIRGTLSTAVFEKDTISVVGGQVMVANAAAIETPNSQSIPYPIIKTIDGQDINFSGEILPTTTSYTAGDPHYRRLQGFSVALLDQHGVDPTVASLNTYFQNETRNGDIWIQAKNPAGAGGNRPHGFKLSFDTGSYEPGTEYKLTFYLEGDCKFFFTNGSGSEGTDPRALLSASVNGAPYTEQSQSLPSGFNIITVSQSSEWHDLSNTNNVDAYPTFWFRQKANIANAATASYYRDIHFAVASQSFQVDNAGGFVPGEIIVAKDADQGPDGRAGFTREYMAIHTTSLGSSEVPAELTLDIASGLFSKPTVISASFNTGGHVYFFTGSDVFPLPPDKTPNVTDSGNPEFYYHVPSNPGQADLETVANNLRNKINSVAPDITATLSGSHPLSASSHILLRVNDQGNFGNEYYAYTGVSSVPHSSQYRFSGGVDKVPATITVERNIDRLVPGNERGNAISLLRDGQPLASQGSNGTGYILLNAQPTDDATPYIDIVERTGSSFGSQINVNTDVNSVFGDVKTVARIGDLSGITDDVNGVPVSGYGIYTDNGFFKGGVVGTYGVIGGWSIGSNFISSSNGAVKLSATGPYHISASKFKVSDTGEMTASAGQIGGFTINATNLVAKSISTGNEVFKLDKFARRITLGDITTNNTFIVDADEGMWLGNSSQDSAPFAVSLQGALTASSGKIGGWEIGASSLETSRSHANGLKILKMQPEADNVFEVNGEGNDDNPKMAISSSGDITIRGNVSADTFGSSMIIADANTGPANYHDYFKTETENNIAMTDIYMDGTYGGEVNDTIYIDADLQTELDMFDMTVLGVEGAFELGSEGNAIGSVIFDTEGAFREAGAIRRVYPPKHFLTNNIGEIKIVVAPGRTVEIITLVDETLGYPTSFGYTWAKSQAEAGFGGNITNWSNYFLSFGTDLESSFYDAVQNLAQLYDVLPARRAQTMKLMGGGCYTFTVLSPDLINSQLYGIWEPDYTSGAGTDNYSYNDRPWGILLYKGGPTNPFFQNIGDGLDVQKSIRAGETPWDTIESTGDIIAYATSDKRLKNHVNKIQDAIHKIQQISGNTFTWNTGAGPKKSGLTDVGVIAQEVHKILPDVTRTVGDIMSVRYEKLIPLLIEGIKEQQEQIDDLRRKLEGK